MCKESNPNPFGMQMLDLPYANSSLSPHTRFQPNASTTCLYISKGSDPNPFDTQILNLLYANPPFPYTRFRPNAPTTVGKCPKGRIRTHLTYKCSICHMRFPFPRTRFHINASIMCRYMSNELDMSKEC